MNTEKKYKKAQLRPLKLSDLKPDHYIGFDVETYGKRNKFYMGGLYDEEGYKAFYDKEEMQLYLENSKFFNKKSKIVATNLSFDFTTLYYRTRFWNEFKLIHRGSDLISCTRKKYKSNTKNNGSQTFIDTMNFFPASVEKLGKILGIPKLKTPACIINDGLGYARKPKNKAEKEELEIYNKRDCEISYKFMIFLQEGFNKLGGKIKLTIASTSLDIWRRKFLRRIVYKEDYVLERNEEDTIHKFIYEGYYGGRTETFNRGLYKGDLQAYDINSLYPSVMLNKYPLPESAVFTEKGHKDLLKYEGFSRVKIYCPYMKFPLLPFRKDGKLTFPIGVFDGVYSHVELRKAIELGYKLIKFDETLYYTDSWFPFEHFVRELYNLRLEYKKQKSEMEIVTKLVMNSLYGKFAQRNMTNTTIYDVQNMNEEETQEYFNSNKESYTSDGEVFICNEEKNCYKPFVIPMLSAYTTAYARLKLYEYIEKYDPYYCDTDSIFTTKFIPETSVLGGMKLEYDIKKAILIKPKMYYLEYKKPDKFGNTHKVRLKGVSRLTLDGFNDILNGKSVSYIKFNKLKESARRGLNVNEVVTITKDISLNDNKRNWFKDFDLNFLGESEPLNISNEDLI